MAYVARSTEVAQAEEAGEQPVAACRQASPLAMEDRRRSTLQQEGEGWLFGEQDSYSGGLRRERGRH